VPAGCNGNPIKVVQKADKAVQPKATTCDWWLFMLVKKMKCFIAVNWCR